MCSDAAVSESCYHAPYTSILQEARYNIGRTQEACRHWTWRYDGVSPSPSHAAAMLDSAKLTQPAPYPKLRSISDPTKVPGSATTNPLIMGVKSSTSERRPSLPSSSAYSSANWSSSSQVSSSNSSSHSTTTSTLSSSKSNNSAMLPGNIRVHRNRTKTPSNILPHPTIHNLSQEDEQPESLGESSGYESFNLRTSRDSSPSSSPGSPRLLSSSTSRQSLSVTCSSTKTSTPSDVTPLDNEFLEQLLAWQLRENEESATASSEDMEAAIREIDVAFSVYSPCTTNTTESKVWNLTTTTTELLVLIFFCVSLKVSSFTMFISITILLIIRL